MHKLLQALALLLLSNSCLVAQQSVFYFIPFTDKSNSNFSIQNPSAFLSQASIMRRLNQNIEITESDLPVNKWYIDSIKSTSVQYLYATKWLNGVVIKTDDSLAMVKIKSFPFVKLADSIAYKTNVKQGSHSNKFDFINYIKAADPQPDNYYGLAQDQIKMLQGDYLHQLGFTGSNMSIAILDAGFHSANKMKCFAPSFSQNKIVTKDFVAFQNDSIFNTDMSTHGSLIWSTMASQLPNIFVGTSPLANYYLIRTEDTRNETQLEEFNWVAGAEYADSIGAWLINSSLGYNTYDASNATFNNTYQNMDGKTTPCAIAAGMAMQKGILPVISAGNSGQDASWPNIGTPADAIDVLTVGSVNSQKTYSLFSSKGPSADNRIKPDIVAKGEGTAFMYTNNQVYTSGQGTSFSAPILCGLAACLWQKHPTKTNYQIRQAIIESAHLFQKPDSLLGYGIPDFFIADKLLQNNVSFLFDLIDKPLIFPIPSQNALNIYCKATLLNKVVIEIFDHYGKKCIIKETSISTFNASRIEIAEFERLMAGTYIIKINIDGLYHTSKVVKL
jgi:serine protease AprX